jgi:hypothetical protein
MQRFACLLLASLGLAATLPTQAEPIRLSEHQLAAVSGRAALPAADSATALPTGPGAGLDLLGLAGQPVTVLDRAAFLATLAQPGQHRAEPAGQPRHRDLALAALSRLSGAQALTSSSWPGGLSPLRIARRLAWNWYSAMRW